MSTIPRIDPVFEKIDLLLAERRTLAASGPQFRIIHRYRALGTTCAPGEEVGGVYLVYRGREFQLRLPVSLLLLFDFLAKHSRLMQAAAQIEVAINSDQFYKQHGANAGTGLKLTRRITRLAVKEYVKRIRHALNMAFQEARVNIDPRVVLVSEPTATNEVAYRLRAKCEWLHIDHTRRFKSALSHWSQE
jgi:hypothetical protein